MDIFTIENFLNDNDINLANALEGKEESFFDTEGVYKGKITSTQQWINPSSEFAKYMQNKFLTPQTPEKRQRTSSWYLCVVFHDYI